MNALEQTVRGFADLVADFRYTEAFDRFYSEDLVKHENEQASTVGLAAEREVMVGYLAALCTNGTTTVPHR